MLKSEWSKRVNCALEQSSIFCSNLPTLLLRIPWTTNTLDDFILLYLCPAALWCWRAHFTDSWANEKRRLCTWNWVIMLTCPERVSAPFRLSVLSVWCVRTAEIKPEIPHPVGNATFSLLFCVFRPSFPSPPLSLHGWELNYKLLPRETGDVSDECESQCVYGLWRKSVALHLYDAYLVFMTAWSGFLCRKHWHIHLYITCPVTYRRVLDTAIVYHQGALGDSGSCFDV